MTTRQSGATRRAIAMTLLAATSGCTPALQSNSAGVGVARPSTDPSAPLTGADRARQVLSRLTFGARPGDVAAAERMGIDRWIDRQLHPESIPDPVADSVLDLLEIAHKSAFELAADHPRPNEYPLSPGPKADSISMAAMTAAAKDTGSAMVQLANMRARASEVDARSDLAVRLAMQRGAVQRELVPSLLVRAEISERQLLEVMTVFWENHFSVSAANVGSPLALVDYDRAIRAHALGKFRDLLGAVAKTPAMLVYLDNYQSVVDSLHSNPTEWLIEQRRAAHPPLGDTSLVHTVHRRRVGINENYARELMELHTLGVDGGYTQRDVQEVARCLTGWGIDDLIDGGTFSFHSAQHDAGDKTVLGVHILGGRGIEDGEQVLDILARHPSTARFIAKKLVIRFVSDSAPPALVDRVAKTYERTDGDIREVLRTIFTSPEFFSRGAYRAKVKTPYELVASVLRVMNAAPDTLPQLAQVVARLGQPIYGRATPDGWPDQAAAWMNGGALMDRVNFGIQVGSNQVRDIRLSAWQPARALLALPPEQQVDGVISAVLGGDAAPETRRAMLAVQSPAKTPQHLGELLAVALGSSDFQRR
ncbi:MAG TPA: DUF1800 domain-containing protein [Gemmatimonadaceae bacterium]|nr:DUF1800 domain-containing protein [Gemmatimonadaceae bacterium]